MKPQLAFVFGGKSVEHEISIITGLQAFLAYKPSKYDAFPLFLTKKNEMYVGDALKEIENFRNIPALLEKCQKVIPVFDGDKTKLVGYPAKKFGKNFEQEIDMALLCVHGTNVEDGALQGYFQTLNIPIVGCDVESAALGMDKYTQKCVLKEAGVPVLEAKRYTAKDYANLDETKADIEKTFGFPVIVKPVDLGSSVGISVAKDEDALTESLDDAFRYANVVLVEHAISNLREINCSVLGDMEDAQASEIEEPVTGGEILSYEDKYMSGGKGAKGSKGAGMASVSRQIPANVPAEKREEIRELAVRAFKALGCNGVARIDFMIDCDNDKLYFNEINTIPGSLSFYLWEPLGKPYAELLDDMVALAEKRERSRESLTFSFDTNVLDAASLGGAKK